MKSSGRRSGTMSWKGFASVVFLLFWGLACGSNPETGEVRPTPVPGSVVAEREARQLAAQQDLGLPPGTRQILFGDLHVHTAFSIDALLPALPMLMGEGVHPPADACDYARFCAGLDFFALTDHAEGLTPYLWKESRESIRQCNATAEGPANPDLVAYLGWEWTQDGFTPETHFGHQNVIFEGTSDDELPRRAILAPSAAADAIRTSMPPSYVLQLLWVGRDNPLNMEILLYLSFVQRQIQAAPLCPEGVDVWELPADCLETASTPAVLIEKLDQWGFDSLVIPHGTAWGLYTPPGYRIDNQLPGTLHDPGRQMLMEVFSGHGNSEEYRDWRAVNEDGSCPDPTAGYEPCCWRAGEIVRQRCEQEGLEDCEARVEKARQDYLEAGVSGYLTIPGASMDDFLDCGQCRDCFLPAMNMRPGGSAQRALAIGNFDDPDHPAHFRFGFIASSDNHSARPGNGFKESGRSFVTEAAGSASPEIDAVIHAASVENQPEEPNSITLEEAIARRGSNSLPFPLWEIERQASFFMTGGLVAVHSTGRSREALWDAMKRREVYGTSGERILLWFNLLNGAEGTVPMGSEARVAAGRSPTFQVKAAGSFVEVPGCPDYASEDLSSERLDWLCKGECENPGDERKKITLIEVMRITLQQDPSEDVPSLIEDPWIRHDCEGCPQGCTFTFEDPEFQTRSREVAYYVRAIQAPTPAVNSGGVRCEVGASGDCISVHPCYGDYRTPEEEDCLGNVEEHAWSSPIWVRP